MARCYSATMPKRQPKRRPALPDIWVVSDARNDTRLEAVLAKMPRGSGLIFRHYHLAGRQRRARFDRLARIARTHGHTVILSGTLRQARQWCADGAYCAPAKAGPSRPGIRLVTAHSLREIARANRAHADAVLLSLAFATRSHPGTPPLGPVRFRLLASRSRLPVIALGGMTRQRAARLRWKKWAATDGI